MTIPDLNVLLYAVDADSSRHAAALGWLERAVNEGKDEIGLPWIVALGFLRLSTSARVFPNPLAVEGSVAWLRALLDNPGVVVVEPGRGHLGILAHLLLVAGSGGNLVTDAHIAALALERDGRVVTGDRDFLRFPGLEVELIY